MFHITDKAHYHNCINGLETLNKKATRAIDKKYFKMTSPPEQLVKFKIISKKNSS